MIIDEHDYLEHFGVKGMRWGVRKKDKPVSAEKQAKREQKAEKFVAKAKLLDTKVSALNVEVANAGYFTRRSVTKRRDEAVNERARALADAEAKRQGKLSSNQRKVVIGASVAAATLAVYGAYQFHTSGEMNRSIMRGKAFMEGKSGQSPWKLNPNLAKPMNADEIMQSVVKPVNPGYGRPGTKMNCRRATMAYEMRRRGHDVAATRTVSAHGQNQAGMFNVLNKKPGEKFVPTGKVTTALRLRSEFKEPTPGRKTEFAESLINNPAGFGKNLIVPSSPGFAIDSKGGATRVAADAKGDMGIGIFRALASEPNGSRGELGVQWGIGGRHSMAYEIVQGKPVVFDAQSGKKFAAPDDLISAFRDLNGVTRAGYTRLDNVPMNDDFLRRWLRNAK